MMNKAPDSPDHSKKGCSCWVLETSMAVVSSAVGIFGERCGSPWILLALVLPSVHAEDLAPGKLL